MIEAGRIVLKIAGREAGKYAVVVEKSGDSFALITGPKSVTGVKRRKCNIEHIEPTEHVLKIGSSDDAGVEQAWKDSGLIETLQIELPKLRTKAAKEIKDAKPAKKAPKKKQ
jgi:large subunit ribosomal protein L14e